MNNIYCIYYMYINSIINTTVINEENLQSIINRKIQNILEYNKYSVLNHREGQSFDANHPSNNIHKEFIVCKCDVSTGITSNQFKVKWSTEEGKFIIEWLNTNSLTINL